jgi:hypothetical protein
MSPKMFIRRPPTTHVLAAVTVLVLFSILIHQTSRHVPLLAGTRFGAGNGHLEGHLLDNINNSTLGVS